MRPGRPLSMTARNLLLPSNYLALGRAARVYERPLQASGRCRLGVATCFSVATTLAPFACALL